MFKKLFNGTPISCNDDDRSPSVQRGTKFCRVRLLINDEESYNALVYHFHFFFTSISSIGFVDENQGLLLLLLLIWRNVNLTFTQNRQTHDMKIFPTIKKSKHHQFSFYIGVCIFILQKIQMINTTKGLEFMKIFFIFTQETKEKVRSNPKKQFTCHKKVSKQQ